jgi:hypothetical protein
LLNKKISEYSDGVTTPVITTNKLNDLLTGDKDKMRKKNVIIDEYKKAMNRKYEAMTVYIRGDGHKKKKTEFRIGFSKEMSSEMKEL